MKLHTLFASALIAGALASCATTSASAQERKIFEWRGSVDREISIIMRGRDLATRYGGRNERGGRGNVARMLPREPGYVTVDMREGRGQAYVVQQPSARNNYTAVIRIRDDRGGDDRYRITAYWRPTRYGYGNGNGNGGWDRGGWENSRDGDRDRDHDRDRDRGRDRDRWGRN